MCTLSFLPVEHGYHLLMNRDEQRQRPEGIPPEVHWCGARQAVFPREPSGGTWVGSNEMGLTFSLINWYSTPQLRTPPEFSRGQIIPRLLSLRTLNEAENLLSSLPNTKLNPFRLIGISLSERRIQEWRSNLDGTEIVSIDWKLNHWYSSGFEEAEASRVRATVFREESTDDGDTPLDSLRQLHASHLPERGPYSICMHRSDARTVSLTELSMTLAAATMRYHSGSPCEASALCETRVTLPLNQ